MKKGLMVSGAFPCVRAGKITEAMSYRGWEHDRLSMIEPPQLYDVYSGSTLIKSATVEEFGDAIRNSDAEIIHIHNEPNWPVLVAKEYTDKPVILNVHDVASARPKSMFDMFEIPAYEAADGLIFVTKEQRDFVIAKGAKIEDKPYAIIGNYATRRYFVEKRIMPYLGGVVYEGGLDHRGRADGWRDHSALADALKKNGVDLHIFSDTNVDYGVSHGPIVEFEALAHNLSRFDWGLCGTPVMIPAWEHSIPNKFFDYLSAGIPVIAYNCPVVKPLCDAGFGVYCYSVDDIVKTVKKVDPKKYKKYVMAHRGQYTMLTHIDPVVELYDKLLKGDSC